MSSCRRRSGGLSIVSPPGRDKRGRTPLRRRNAGRSAIRRVDLNVAGDLPLPAGAVLEELVLVVEQLLPGLDGKLVVRPFDDGVHRAGLLAHAAIDALRHVDVVPGGPAGAVVPARP